MILKLKDNKKGDSKKWIALFTLLDFCLSMWYYFCMKLVENRIVENIEALNNKEIML